MGAFRIISFEVGVFHRIVSSLTISFSNTLKLTLLLLCLLSNTTTSTTTKKPYYYTMAKTPCNQVMQHGSDLIGIRFFLLLHHDPDFAMFTKILKDKYDHSIADQSEVDALLFFDTNKDKLVSTALKDLKTAFAQSVVEQSIHLNTTAVANNGLALFKALPFKWMDKSGSLHLLQSSNDLAKAVDIAMVDPSPTHSMYSKELVIYISTSGLYCERDDIPDCSNLSKIFPKVPKKLTSAELLALSASTSTTTAATIKKTATSIAEQVKLAAEASRSIREVIPYDLMPTEVSARVHKRLDKSHIIIGNDINRFSNALTTDTTAGTVQAWNFVEFPLTHCSYLILRDGSLCKFLRHQEKHHRSALQHLNPMLDFTAHSWFDFCISLEYSAFNNRIWVHPYYCHQRICNSDNGYGFLVADPLADCDSDLPLKYDYLLEDWNDQLYQALSTKGVLPDGRAQDILRSCSQNGFLFLRTMHHILNPNLMDIPSSVCNRIPSQNGETYDVYVSIMRFYHCMIGFLQSRPTDYGDRHTQDVFLSNMDHSDAIMKHIHADRNSTVQDLLIRYKKGTFINTIRLAVISLRLSSLSVGSDGGKQRSSLSSRSSFSRNKTNAANVVHATSEFHNEPDFNTAGLYSIAFENINLDDCNDADVGLLSAAINQMGSNLNTAFDTSRPCVICGGTGHTFDGCKALLDSPAVRTAFIKLRVAIQRLYGVATKFGQPDLNALQCHTISSLDMVDRSLPHAPSSAGGSSGSSNVSVNEKSSIYKLMKLQTKTLTDSNKLLHARLSSLEEMIGETGNGGGTDDVSDGTGGSSLNTSNMADFIRAASKSR